MNDNILSHTFCLKKGTLSLYTSSLEEPGGALHIFRVRGRAIGKGIYFPDIDIKNGINFIVLV